MTDAVAKVEFDSDVPEGGAPVGPGSLLWRLYRDRRSYMLIGVIGTIQNMHPAVSAGVVDHSKIFTEPFSRLQRSIPPVLDVIYSPPQAGAGPRLRDFHRDIKGVDASGDPYHALNPDTYWFTHVTFVEYAILAADLVFGEPLDDQEKDQLIRESVTWWARYGMSMRPVVYTWEEYERYLDEVCASTLNYTPIVKWSLEDLGKTEFDSQLGVPAWLFRIAARIGHRIGGRAAVLSAMPDRYLNVLGVRPTQLNIWGFRAVLSVVNTLWRIVPLKLRLQPQAYAAGQQYGGVLPS
ncbi:oxygenase MpaB family protein [Gordonia sp. MP11Mi]|uniref:ER-bound oxygenase mpaB/mpaB'/Rubber oxygenase catalytic domain-containing protein n=1 Tax=Gordonia sp. MP11Mi TaxID=3022769 RepID=A0AA97GWZ8_9ACTN